MIEVILLERIERLGTMGQTVRVKPGFARNFLLPRRKALRATKENMALFEKQRAALEAQNAKLRAEAENQAGKMDGIKVIIIRQAGETGMLYGSVTSRDVAEGLAAAGYKIDRHQVQIDVPIKMLGLVPVKIRLHPEVAVKVTLNVARSPEEAAVQAEKGAAVIHRDSSESQTAAPSGAEVSAVPSGDGTEEQPKAKRKTRAAKPEKAGEAAADETAAKPKKTRKSAAKPAEE